MLGYIFAGEQGCVTPNAHIEQASLVSLFLAKNLVSAIPKKTITAEQIIIFISNDVRRLRHIDSKL